VNTVILEGKVMLGYCCVNTFLLASLCRAKLLHRLLRLSALYNMSQRQLFLLQCNYQ